MNLALTGGHGQPATSPLCLVSAGRRQTLQGIGGGSQEGRTRNHRGKPSNEKFSLPEIPTAGANEGGGAGAFWLSGELRSRIGLQSEQAKSHDADACSKCLARAYAFSLSPGLPFARFQDSPGSAGAEGYSHSLPAPWHVLARSRINPPRPTIPSVVPIKMHFGQTSHLLASNSRQRSRRRCLVPPTAPQESSSVRSWWGMTLLAVGRI